MKIEDLYELYTESFLVDTDTRNIRNGSIFFALKGANFNGNKFAQEALNKGAKYAVVDEIEYKANDNVFLVTDVLETLQELATYHRIQLGIPIISLTGSNGKTTTKELINSVLSKEYKTKATKGNLNNHIGVPLTLLSMNSDVEIGIVEMGANHHKEIELLSNISQPDYGYITNFGKAHLEGFGSVEGVITAKSELYDYIIDNNKKVFVNPSDAIQMERTKSSNRILFDESIKFLEVNPFVKLKYNGLEIQSNLIGSYNYNNIAAAITIGKELGVSSELIKEAIEEYISSNNRSQIVNRGTNRIILDAYNANPTSMKAALENFDLLKESSKVVILGDMFELGETSEEEHQFLASFLEGKKFDKIFLVGENFFKTQTEFKKCKNYESLKELIGKSEYHNTTFLIKGSRGMALERILDVLN